MVAKHTQLVDACQFVLEREQNELVRRLQTVLAKTVLQNLDRLVWVSKTETKILLQ